jgi:filamentous hemagglutinin family protein
MLKQAMAWMGLLVACGLATAAPQGEQVVGGSANFNRAGDVTTITTSRNAIINYNSFNIAGNETVRFVQPSARSRVLNRIRGNDPTQIDGTLLSNGIVYIVNPAGVYFGNGALVNVGGLYAGAGNVSNADFLNNINHFTDVSGNVVNRGTIDASLVAMVGKHVANYGTINVPNGMVTMVAGDDVVIAERDRSFSVRIEGLGAQAAGSDSETGVTNEGTINAQGGSVVWGAGDVYAMGIHNTGSVKAQSVEVQAETTAHLGGTIDASNDAGVGGDVVATASQLEVSGTIDASGADGGGTIKLGGDWQGGGEIKHADNTLITNSAHLIASAINNGAGGTIVIWSDGTTVFLGTAEATGTDGFAGGSVETSGKYLHVMGGLVVAPDGQWLLDPFDVEVGDFGGAGNSSAGTFDGGAPNTWTPNASPSQVDVADVETSLNAGTSVTITTTGGGAEPGNITVTSAISKTGGGDAILIFDADGNIDVQATIAATTGQLGVTLDSNAGDVTVDSTITTNGGDFTVQNAATYTGNAAVTTGGGAVAITTTGNQDYDDGAIDAGAGNVTLTTTAGGTINEITENQTPKITTTGTFTADAQASGSIGDGVAAGFDSNTDPTGLFDVDAAVLDLEVVGTGDINVMSHAAGGTQVDQAHADDGFPRIYTVGPMVLNDSAVLSADPTLGAGFIWLISESTIDALNAGNLVATTGASANLRIDANGDIGTLANPLLVDTTGLFILNDRGSFDVGGGGAGSVYMTNQRAGQTNITTMQLDTGDAVIQAPGDIVTSNFTGFDTSFNGAGDYTITSTGGGIFGPDPITMGGGTVTLNSASDIGTSADPLEITGFGGLALNANGGAGQIFLTDMTFAEIGSNLLTGLDPTVIGVAPVLVISSTNTNVDIQSDGTDIDVNEFDVPAESIGADFTPTLSSVSGDIDVNADAIDIPLANTNQQFEIIAQGGGVNLDNDAIDVGSGTIIIDAQNGAIAQLGAGPHITNDPNGGAGSGRAELTADTSIGSVGSPIEFLNTDEILLDVNDDLIVQHDGVTDISLLSVAADPAGLPTWTFTNFAGETIDDAAGNFLPVSFDTNPTHTSADTDHMLINDVQATASTNYSFTSKTGHVIVDDDNSISAATPATLGGADTAGDGGIFSGNGNVTLIARRGSVIQELARDDPNVRTNAVSSTVGSLGPLVTIRALGESGDTGNVGQFEGSIGGNSDPGNGGAAVNAFDVHNARRFVLEAQDHQAIRGNNQPVELYDSTVDPDGPDVDNVDGTVINYAMLDFSLFTFNMSSDGTDLTITEITSDHEFDSGTQGTRISQRANTGNVTVGTPAGNNGIRTRLMNSDPVLLPEEPFYGLTEMSVRVVSVQESVLLHDNAIRVNGTGGAPIGAGTGTVRLNASKTVDEATDSTVVNITNAGLLQIFANNAGGAAEAIGNTVATGNTDEALDVSVESLVAQAGQIAYRLDGAHGRKSRRHLHQRVGRSGRRLPPARRGYFQRQHRPAQHGQHHD